MGQVLEALERNHLADNTLVIATSDNGAAGRVYEPLRGCKTQIYERGLRVPFLARWPGKIKLGSTCNDIVCLNDLIATCAELLSAKLPDNAAEDSVSILPDLLVTAAGPLREATVHQVPNGDLAIRQPRPVGVVLNCRCAGESKPAVKLVPLTTTGSWDPAGRPGDSPSRPGTCRTRRACHRTASPRSACPARCAIRCAGQ